jgi:CheY-like chemotaxis protein
MQPTRVIVVDGYRDVADTLAVLLETRGFEARAVYTAADALSLTRSWRPAALILDLRLPEMSGHDLALAIRSEITPCPVFVALTGYHQPELPERSRELGFAAHLMKPCDPQVIFGVLGGRHAPRAA